MSKIDVQVIDAGDIGELLNVLLQLGRQPKPIAKVPLNEGSLEALKVFNTQLKVERDRLQVAADALIKESTEALKVKEAEMWVAIRAANADQNWPPDSTEVRVNLDTSEVEVYLKH